LINDKNSAAMLVSTQASYLPPALTAYSLLRTAHAAVISVDGGTIVNQQHVLFDS
jgi:hypothetical protein